MSTETKRRGNPAFTTKQRETGSTADKIFVLKSVYKTKITVQPAFDHTIGWYKGVERLSEADKRDRGYFVVVDDEKGKNTSVVLEEGLVIDLNKEVDAINWEWLQHLKQIAMSFEEAQKNPAALFYVHQEGVEASKSNAKHTKTYEALKYVMEDNPTNYADRAMLLGHDMYHEHTEIVKEYLLDTAKNTPDKIINVYAGDTLALRLLVLKAKQKGIILFEDNVYRFGATLLGINDDSIISYLQQSKGKEVADLIDRAVNPELYKEEV